MEGRIKAYTEDEIVNRVIEKHIKRSEQGMKTYWTTLKNNNTKTTLEWVDEAIEEALDQVVYLEKLRDKIVQSTS